MKDNPTPSGELDDQIAKLINDTVDDLESYMKENDQLREQLDAVVEALRKCVDVLSDPRIGSVNYMEGSRIYVDFNQAKNLADAALAKIKEKCA